MGAALFGVGEWMGPVPARTRMIRIVLPSGLPAAGFALISCEVLSLPGILLLASRRSVVKTVAATGLRLLGRALDSNDLLQGLLGSTPLAQYHEWRTGGERSLDPAGVDASDENRHDAPHVRIVVRARETDRPEDLSVTLASLDRQSSRNWSLIVVGEATRPADGQRCPRVGAEEEAGRLWDGLKASDIVLPILAGDTVPETAIATVAEFVASRPDMSLFYADEDSISAQGRYFDPELKPDWSPIFHSFRAYVGRAVYFRRRALEDQAGTSSADFLRPSNWDAMFAREKGCVGHIRRVLLTKADRSRGSFGVAMGTVRHQVERPSAEKPRAVAVTLIIPTRDRADLLAACLASLEKTSPRDFDVLIVDNGSEQAEARRLLEQARGRPGMRVLDAPGLFNFASLCNRGAALAQSGVLVFLNNDTEVTQPDWLSRLVCRAVHPDVGAVGPKLLYASGRVQHAGLVLSLGGYAAHIDAGAAADDEGYLGRLAVPHEVSAVTGACLVVEKSKFDAVGGFDEKKYPIELGDVDLCLRLARRGWKTVFTPESVLIHHESASRGRAESAKRYEWERRHFLSDWKDVLPDDPHFHPALSLAARRTSLDR